MLRNAQGWNKAIDKGNHRNDAPAVAAAATTIFFQIFLSLLQCS